MESVKHLSAKEIQGLMNHQLKTDAARTGIALVMVAVLYTGIFWGFGRFLDKVEKTEKEKKLKTAA